MQEENTTVITISFKW